MAGQILLLREGKLRYFTAAAALVTFVAGTFTPAWAMDLKVSLETPPSHIRNVTMARYADEVAARSGGAIRLEIFPSGQLYDTAGAPKALATGALDLAFPNFNMLGRFEPNSELLALPMFYGAQRNEVRAVLSGESGQKLWRMIEEKLRSKVLGGHVEAGDEKLFLTGKQLRSYDDMNGLKIGVPPNTLIIARQKELGANPVRLARSDTVLALTQGQVDGVIGYDDTVRAGKMWDAGIKYAFDDREGWSGYIPLISQVTWNKLTADQQKIMVDSWAAVVGWARENAEKVQEEARKANQEHGIVYFTPAPADIAEARKRLMAAQASLVQELKMDAAFVSEVQAQLDALRK